jgi:TolA-binding protein
MRLSDQPDEIIRLVDGSLTFKVDHLGAGERFRVMTSDAEVEVVGTAFDVTARADHLVGVRVLRGVVRIRPVGGQERLVSAGQSWAAAPPAPPAPVAPSAQLGAPPPVAPPASAQGARAGPRPPAPASAPAPASMQATRSAPGAPVPPAPSAAQQAFDIAWGALRAGAFDRAADGFGRAAQLGGARVAEDALYWQSVALARAGRSARAIRAFEGFLATYPDSARGGEASVMLGWLLFDARDYPGAARRFRSAVGDPSARVRTSAAEGLAALEKASPREK